MMQTQLSANVKPKGGCMPLFQAQVWSSKRRQDAEETGLQVSHVSRSMLQCKPGWESSCKVVT